MDVFELTQGDQRPSLERTLLVDGEPLDLTNATGVRLVLEGLFGTQVDAACTILDPRTDGKVRYDWQAADTNRYGSFRGQFVASFPDGEETVPSGDLFRVTIHRRVGDQA